MAVCPAFSCNNVWTAALFCYLCGQKQPVNYEETSFCGTPRASVLRQRGSPEYEPVAHLKGLPSGNEIGVRYGAQLFMGDGRGPEFEAISIDYARYNYYNIGFRTGLNLFFDDEVCDYYSIPMQFTWRTERIRGLVFPGDGEAGSWVAAALLSIIPKQFEAHTGFTPGMMLGPLSREPYSGNFLVKHRFSCTYDLGVRLIIPIWRFNLYGDFTYHCYLTDNFGFAYGDYRPGRSYMELGVGLSFNF